MKYKWARDFRRICRSPGIAKRWRDQDTGNLLEYHWWLFAIPNGCSQRRSVCHKAYGVINYRTNLRPAGTNGPCVIHTKIILQQIWQLKIRWDKSLPMTYTLPGGNIRSRSMESLSIPRHVMCKNLQTIELHGFCDVSEAAYDACNFIRSINQTEDVATRDYSARDLGSHHSRALRCLDSNYVEPYYLSS